MVKRRSNSSSHSKKVVSAVIAGMMVMGSGTAVFADNASNNTAAQSTAASALFKDVKSGYWAEKHIYKLASQSILLGNNGLFRPNDNVTQQEAVTMAIRFAGLEGKVDKNASVALLYEHAGQQLFQTVRRASHSAKLAG